MSIFKQDLAVAAASFKEAMAYRASMMFSIVSGPLFFFVNFVIWTAVFSSTGKQTISGYTLSGMITYLAINTASFYLLWDDVSNGLADNIRNGGLTAFLLRPLHYWRYEFARKIGHRALAFVVEFIPVIIVLAIFFGPQILKSETIVYYTAGMLIAIVISFMINALLGMIAFWTVRPQGFIRIYNMVSIFITGGILPLSLFPDWFQKISLYLPFQFIRYVPTRLFMGSYELAGVAISPLNVLFYGALQIVILVLLVVIIWHSSLKKYCGVGQ